jgi:hypothetical protein
MASSDRFVAVGKEEMERMLFIKIFNDLASVAKPQVFYYLVSDAKIFDIIYQLSPLQG